MNVLFIVEGSLSNPVLASQGIPHFQENSKKGINYSVLSFEDMDYLKQDSTARERFNLAKTELLNYAQIYPIEIKKSKFLAFLKLSTLNTLITTVRTANDIIKKNKINIVHGRSNVPSLSAVIIKMFRKIKVLYDNRGLVSDEFDKKKKFRIIVENLIERYLLLRSDAIVVVSNAFKNYLSVKYQNDNINKKINVVENSFSEKRFIFSEQLRLEQRKKYKLEDKFIMVYSGPSVYWQRFDLVLTTFKLLKQIKKEAFLLVVSYDTNIKQAIVESGINMCDFSVYNIPASEVNNLLIMGDFGVIFRDDRIRSKVCAPIKLGEYLASGLPILSMSEIGDTDSIIHDYNVGVIVKNVNEILIELKKIIELTNVPNIKKTCRKAAEKRLSLVSSADKYFSIYNNLK